MPWPISARHCGSGAPWPARRNGQADDPRALSHREQEIIDRAAHGGTDKQIAHQLGLSRSTVTTHLGGAMRKLGVTSRVELLRLLGAFAR